MTAVTIRLDDRSTFVEHAGSHHVMPIGAVSLTTESINPRSGESEQTGSVAPASPVTRNAWQRHPPKSTSLRAQERQGSGIQASPRNRVNASDSFQIHSSERARTFSNCSVVMRPAA